MCGHHKRYNAHNMNNKKSTYVGIDIGSSRSTCVIGVEAEDNETVQVLGVGMADNPGMRRGVVANVDEAVESITRAVDEAERMSGFTIERATVSVNGNHLKSRHSKGVIAVSGGNRDIDDEDIARVEEAATVVQIPPNREIIHVFPREYYLDGQEDIQDPRGMRGVRLEVQALLVTASTPATKGISRVVYQAGLEASQLYVAGLASARAVLSRDQRENGVALLDIGHATTTIAIFEEDELYHLHVLPVGSGHITNDLAIGLQTDLTTANKLKLESGKLKSRKTIKIIDNRGEEAEFETMLIREIINARLEEIFELVNDELARVDRSRKLPAGIVLTGGGANTPGIQQLAKVTCELPVIIGDVTGLSGILDNLENPSMSTAVGLMLLDRDAKSITVKGRSMNVSGASSFLRTIFERLSP